MALLPANMVHVISSLAKNNETARLSIVKIIMSWNAQQIQPKKYKSRNNHEKKWPNKIQMATLLRGMIECVCVK